MDKEKPIRDLNGWNVIGHHKIIRSLQQNIIAGKITHSYLFAGPESLGKMTVAKEFAKSLQCEENIKPCNKCKNCQGVDNNSNPDVLIISKGEDRIKINDIRKIQHHLSLKSYGGQYKICIINNVEIFTLEAANSILKILEEPKGKVIFILIAGNIDRIIPTVVSRCTIYNFHLVPEKYIIENLKTLSDGDSKNDNISEIVKLSFGRPGIALKMLHDPSFLIKKNKAEEEITKILETNLSNSFEVASLWKIGNDEDINMINILLEWYRDLLLFKLGCKDLIISKNNIDKYYRRYSEYYTVGKIKDIIDYAINAKDLIFKNINSKLIIENLVILIKNE